MNSPLPVAPVAPSPGAREDPDSAGLREAGFLASVYPNVYLDFGLAVPFLSVADEDGQPEHAPCICR